MASNYAAVPEISFLRHEDVKRMEVYPFQEAISQGSILLPSPMYLGAKMKAKGKQMPPWALRGEALCTPVMCKPILCDSWCNIRLVQRHSHSIMKETMV